jgi:hypothetical protein
VNFSIYIIFLAALGPGVHSASNRNEYQKQKNNNVSREKSAVGVGLPYFFGSNPGHIFEIT